MSSVTTQSGQARSRLIEMFRQAQRLVLIERKRATAARSLIKRAVEDSTVREQGDVVHLVMPHQTWDDLRSANDQP